MDARRTAQQFVDGIGVVALAGTGGLATVVWAGRKRSDEHTRRGEVAGHKHQACGENTTESPDARSAGVKCEVSSGCDLRCASDVRWQFRVWLMCEWRLITL